FSPSPGERVTVTCPVIGNACGVAEAKNGSSETVTASVAPRPAGSLAATVSVAWFTLVSAGLNSVAVGGVGPELSSVMLPVEIEPTLRAASRTQPNTDFTPSPVESVTCAALKGTQGSTATFE